MKDKQPSPPFQFPKKLKWESGRTSPATKLELLCCLAMGERRWKKWSPYFCWFFCFFVFRLCTFFVLFCTFLYFLYFLLNRFFLFFVRFCCWTFCSVESLIRLFYQTSGRIANNKNLRQTKKNEGTPRGKRQRERKISKKDEAKKKKAKKRKKKERHKKHKPSQRCDWGRGR